MRYFEESGPHGGNLSELIINAGNGRLNACSVKIFTDGKITVIALRCQTDQLFRCFMLWWSSGKKLLGHVCTFLTFLSYMSHTVITTT
jgi:hypothetical protein